MAEHDVQDTWSVVFGSGDVHWLVRPEHLMTHLFNIFEETPACRGYNPIFCFTWENAYAYLHKNGLCRTRTN